MTSQNRFESRKNPLKRFSDVLDVIVENVKRCRGSKAAKTGENDVLVDGESSSSDEQSERDKMLEMSIYLQETNTAAEVVIEMEQGRVAEQSQKIHMGIMLS
jgi:hypothetical protein